MFQIVANYLNGIDVDKFDYIKRDTYNIGLEYMYDFSRIIRQVKVIDGDICYPYKIARDVYNIYYIRFKLHRDVYNHPVVKSLEYMICDILNIIDPILELSNSIDTIKQIQFNDTILEIIKFYRTDSIESQQIINQAKKIINQIETRNIYKYIGEISFYNSKIKTKIIDKIHNFVNNIFEKTDIIIQNLEFGYENVSYNPLNNIYFYNEENEKIKLQKEKINRMLPNEINTNLIRIFIKNPKNYSKNDLLKIKKIINNFDICDLKTELL